MKITSLHYCLKKQKNIQVDDVVQLSAVSVSHFNKTIEFLTKNGFKEMDI